MKLFASKSSPKYGFTKCNNVTLPFMKNICISWSTFWYELDLKYENFDMICLVVVFLVLVGFLKCKQLFWKDETKVSGAELCLDMNNCKVPLQRIKDTINMELGETTRKLELTSELIETLKNGLNRNLQVEQRLRMILKMKYNVKASELPEPPTCDMKHEAIIKIIEELSVIIKKCKETESQSNQSQMIGDTVTDPKKGVRSRSVNGRWLH